MKKILLSILCASLAIAIVAQDSNPAPKKTREEYMRISKSQKTTAFVFLGIGAVAIGIAAPGNVDFGTLGTLVVVAAIATLASIPLFIASAKNKKRAKKMPVSLNFDWQRTQVLNGLSIRNQAYPALGLRVRL